MGLRTTLKSLGQSTVELGHHLVSEFITNKDESKGILDYDKYQEYTKQLENPYLTQTESDSIQGKMISEGIIDPYRYSNYLSKTSSTEQSKEDTKSGTNAFRTGLSTTLKDNYVAGDKYQREVLNKAIDELTKQYQWTLENVETTYKEYGDETLKNKRDELRPEYEQLIKDSAKKFAGYINEGMDYNTAYSKLIDEGKEQANRIVQIQNQLRRRQDWGSGVVGAFKQAGESLSEGRIDKALGKSVLGLFNIVNGALNLLGEGVEEGKQLAGGYDLLEELNSLNIYKDSKPILNQWRTLKSYGYEIIDALPQILPSIGAMIVGNKASGVLKLDQLMTQLARGGKLADTLVDVSKTGKFLSESLQDFLIMDAAAQPIMGRPITSEDFWTNWMYNLPINAGIAMISKGLKMTDKIPRTLLTAMGTDADKLSKEYIDILKDISTTPEDAAIALMANNSLINRVGKNIEPEKQKLFEKVISYVDLPEDIKKKHIKAMEHLIEYNKNIDEGTTSYKDILTRKSIDSMPTVSILEEAEGGNVLKTYLNRVKILQDATLTNNTTLNKMVHGTVLNLYKQGALTKDVLTSSIDALPEGYGKNIIKAIRYGEPGAISKVSKAMGKADDTVATAIKKDIDDTYRTFEHTIISSLYKNNPKGKWTVGQYQYNGNGIFKNMITEQEKSFDQLSTELLSIDKNWTETSVIQTSKIKNEVKKLRNNPDLQVKNADGKISLSKSIYEGATGQGKFIDIYNPDTMAKGALTEMNSILTPFGISYTKNVDGTLDFWITSKGLEDFNKTLEDIESKGRDFLNLTDNSFKAYQVIFLKQHMKHWDITKKIIKTLEEQQNIKLDAAIIKPTFFENLYTNELAVDNKLLNVKESIEPEHAITLNKALNNGDFDKIEEASAAILINDAMKQGDIMKALPLYKHIPAIKEAIISIDDFRIMLPKGINANKEISTILGKIVADIQSTQFMINSMDAATQKKIYTVTISKLLTQDEKLLIKISDTQSAWTEIINSNNKSLLGILDNTDIRLGVELSLSDKLANISNLSKMSEAASIAKNELSFKDGVIKLKQKLKDMSNKDVLEITDNIHGDTILKMFIAESLSTTKYYSTKALNKIFDKFQALIQFVKSLDGGYKINVVKGETKIVDGIINIGREDIMRLVRSDVNSDPIAIYNALFQAIKTQTNIAELYKLQSGEIGKYIKGDIKPNLISDLITDFSKTIGGPKKAKESLKQFIKVYEPSMSSIFTKYPDILEQIETMIESGISVDKVRELAMEVFSKESINNISKFTEYLFKLNELTKQFGNIISPKEAKKVIEKAQAIKDILDRLDAIGLGYKGLSQTQLQESLVPILGTTNKTTKEVTQFEGENLITSTTSMPGVLLDIDKSIKKTYTNSDELLSKTIKQYGVPETIAIKNIINALNSKVSTIAEAIGGWLTKNMPSIQGYKPVNYLNTIIGEDTIRQYLKMGGEEFMSLDTYITNKLTAEILHANGMYNFKNITDINNYIADKTMDLTLTTLGKDYRGETRNMIAKYLMDNGMISDITAKDIPESLPGQIAAYKLMDWGTDRSKEDAQNAVAGIVVEIKKAFFDTNKDISKKQASAFADELSYTIEDIDEGLVDRMVDDIWDKMYNKNLFTYSLDIIGEEHKPFEAMQYNIETVLGQAGHARKGVSLAAKVRQLGIDDALKRGMIDKATVSFGKYSYNLKTAKWEDVFDDMLWKYEPSKKIQLSYTTKGATETGIETISYNGVWGTSLGKWFVEKLGIKELSDRRITRLEIFQAMRDSIYNSIGFKNIDFNGSIDTKLLNKKQKHILNSLNAALDKTIKWLGDASGYNIDALQKIFNTQIDLIDNVNIKELPVDYQGLTITGIVPRYNIVSDIYQTGAENIGESIGNNIAHSLEDIFDSAPREYIDDKGKLLSIDSNGISTTPNRESDRFIIEAIDNNSGKKYIGVIEQVDGRNVFTPYNSIEPEVILKPTEYRGIISDIKFKENFDELGTYFKC